MLLVIFGAGASHDCRGGREPGWPPLAVTPPPLAKDLVAPNFDAIADDAPGARAVIARLRDAVRPGQQAASIEEQLAELATRSETSPILRRQLLSFRVHLFNLIFRTVDQDFAAAAHGQTNYLRLMNRILDWHLQSGESIRLATFNYDCLLDRALSDLVLDWNLHTFPSFIQREDFRYFKLHGSTAWSRQIVLPDAQRGPSLAAALHHADLIEGQTGDLTCEPPAAQLITARARDLAAALPAIAIPVAGKLQFETPDDHLALLRHDLAQVDRVVIVGWRAAEQHAVDLLMELKPGFDLGVVTFGDDSYSELMGNLDLVGRRARPRFVANEGFSSFVASGMTELDGMLYHQR